MGGVDRPICSCGLSKPLNRAVRLRRHVTFFRHDDDGFIVTAELRARCPRSPEPFRHADVSDVRECCPQQEDGGENDNGAHSLLALGLEMETICSLPREPTRGNDGTVLIPDAAHVGRYVACRSAPI